MESNSLPDSFPIRNNLIGKNLTNLLNDYLQVQIYNIPSSERSNLLNDPHITTRSFLISYWEKYLHNTGKKFSISLKGFERDKYLYETLLTLVNAVQSKLLTEENFDLRCKLLCGVISLKEGKIKEYYKRHTIRYYLFSNLFNIIYHKTELTRQEIRITDHYLGYSNRHKKLGLIEAASRLKVSTPEISNASRLLEGKIDHLIRKFKMLAPFNSYRSKHNLYGKTIKLTKKYFDYIREIENNNQMSDFFIAKVFSIIYNYNEVIISLNGEYHFCLILRGTEETISETLSYQYMKRILETEQETSENNHTMEYCRNRVKFEPKRIKTDDYDEEKDMEAIEEPDEEWTPGYKSKTMVELNTNDKEDFWDDTNYLLEEFDNSRDEEGVQEPEELTGPEIPEEKEEDEVAKYYGPIQTIDFEDLDDFEDDPDDLENGEGREN